MNALVFRGCKKYSEYRRNKRPGISFVYQKKKKDIFLGLFSPLSPLRCEDHSKRKTNYRCSHRKEMCYLRNVFPSACIFARFPLSFPLLHREINQTSDMTVTPPIFPPAPTLGHFLYSQAKMLPETFQTLELLLFSTLPVHLLRKIF